MDKKAINAKFKELAELKVMAAELADAISEIEDEVKAYMKENDLTELFGDEHRALWTSYEKSSFDTKKFKAENPKVAEMYTSVKEQRRFTFA